MAPFSTSDNFNLFSFWANPDLNLFILQGYQRMGSGSVLSFDLWVFPDVLSSTVTGIGSTNFEKSTELVCAAMMQNALQNDCMQEYFGNHLACPKLVDTPPAH